MAQEVTVQEAPQELPQQAASQEAASPLLEAFRILMERFKASQDGFEFKIQFSPRLELPFEEFEELTKGFDSVNFVEFGKVTFADLISVIAERQDRALKVQEGPEAGHDNLQVQRRQEDAAS